MGVRPCYPLHLVVPPMQLIVMACCWEKGANMDAPSLYYGWTPLHAASSGGQAEIVRLLFDKGADPDVPDKNGRMPLRIASLYGQKKAMKLLTDSVQ